MKEKSDVLVFTVSGQKSVQEREWSLHRHIKDLQHVEQVR